MFGRDPVAEYYDARAPVYDETAGYLDPLAERLRATIKPKLRKILEGRRVLEIACGTGYWTQVISGSAESILATDINHSMIEMARRRLRGNHNVDFLVTDAYTLGGVRGSFDAAFAYVIPFLALEGRRKIDTAVVTHPHNDHYGGLISLIDAVEVGEVLVGTRSGEEQYQRLLRRMEEEDIEVRTILRGERLKYGDALVEVLHPSKHDLDLVMDDPNALSVVLRLSYGSLDVLFTGDLTPAVQRRLVEAGDDLACDILKVPHHGAPSAVDSKFLEALGARVAVISVGSRFSSHPCPETIRQLERSGARTFSTVTDGAVTVTSDGRTTTVHSHASGITEVLP